MKKLLVAVLLLGNVILAYSQSGTRELSKFYFGVKVNINESQIKPYLFGESTTGDRSRHSYGISFMSYLKVKRNWYVGLGGTFSTMTFLNEKRFGHLQKQYSPIDTYEESFQNIVGSLKYKIIVQFDDSPCQNPPKPGDYPFSIGVNTFNKVQSLGIPILLGRTMGKKSKKLYAEISVLPTLIIKKEMAYSGMHGLGVIKTNVFQECIEREDFSKIHSVRLITESQIEVVDYNIKGSRLDTRIEIGMLEVLKKVYYKVGVFYGESLTPLTKVEEKNYYGQILGCKLEIGILNFK